VLGLAYGIVEEGLMVKSFFDPNWMDLGLLGVYGRWAGVNWVWSLELTLFHAVFSIAIPILLVELLFPDRRDESWVSRRGMFGLNILLWGDVVFGYLALTPYRPPFVPYILAILAVIGLCLLAKRMPASWAKPNGLHNASKPWKPGFLGFIATVIFFIIAWVLPNVDVPVAVTMGAMLLLAAVVLGLLRLMSGDGAWGDTHKLALVSGALMFFILLGPLQQLDTQRVDNTSGMALVGLVAIVCLFLLSRKVARRPLVSTSVL